MINSILNLLRVRTDPTGQLAQEVRINSYLRYKRLYDGYAIRSETGTNTQYRKLRYNPARPIVNVSADFLAGKDITFTIEEDEDATKLAKDIWEYSGGDSAFLENAISGAVYGDACIIVRNEKETGKQVLNWIDPSCVTPIFDPSNVDLIMAMRVEYFVPYVDVSGKAAERKVCEEWANGKITVSVDDKVDESLGGTYDEKAFQGVPAVWIRNQKVKGEQFGRSDLEPITELVEQYDHLMEKMSRIIDYYASPNLKVKGVQKGSLQTTRGEKTMYYLPVDGDIEFIEWQGTAAPAIQEHLQMVRENIAEMSETPLVAFSSVGDTSVQTNLAGVAIRLLYAPLIKKTERKRKAWEDSLKEAMRYALLLAGKDIPIDQLNIEWQDPLPVNDTETWTVAGMKKDLGVSQKQILREMGYSEEEIEQFEEESAEEAEAAAEAMAKQFSAGNVPGSPYGKPIPGKPAAAPKEEPKEKKE